jgi:alpha-aminoadipate/glutamate carrier protein LysW
VSYCPECEAVIDEEFEDIGEILSCPECGVELEVISVDPIEFDLAPIDDDEDDEFSYDDAEDEEDWDDDDPYDEDDEDEEDEDL